MVGDVWVASGSEEDGVLVAEGIEAVGGHHGAVEAVVVAAPVEVFEVEGEGGVGGGEGFEDAASGGDDFFADAVSGDGGDAVGLHAGVLDEGVLDVGVLDVGVLDVGGLDAGVLDAGGQGYFGVRENYSELMEQGLSFGLIALRTAGAEILEEGMITMLL